MRHTQYTDLHQIPESPYTREHKKKFPQTRVFVCFVCEIGPARVCDTMKTRQDAVGGRNANKY
jgi:hypothetical protein